MKALFVTLVICSALFIQCAISEESESYYDSAAVVTDVDGEVVEFETPDGNLWAMYGFGYEVGEHVNVSFSDNGTTHYIYDDVVLDAVKVRGVSA